MSNSVILKKYLDIINEYPADAAITPGMLIELNSDGEVKAHATAGGNVLPMFALEDELQGNGLEDNYAAGDRVQCWVPVRGEEVNTILADGENVSVGNFLESAGNGYLRKHVVDSTGDYLVIPLVAIALEAKDLSGSSGEGSLSETIGLNKRIKVRIV